MRTGTRPLSVLALVNQKGGCGKTTTAVNLAGALAARGERVLLADLDPQAHATLGLGCAPGAPGAPAAERPTLAEVLLDDASPRAAVHEVAGDIRLLPGTPRLAEFEEIAERSIEPERRLAAALDELSGDFDFVILDCPPRVDGVLCANALYAATTALLVIETGAFALQGAVAALRVLEDVAERQDHEFRLRAIATMFDRSSDFARELLVALHGRFGSVLYDTVVRTSVRLREAPAHGLPVQIFAPDSRGAADFAALAAEVAADVTEIMPLAARLGAGAV